VPLLSKTVLIANPLWPTAVARMTTTVPKKVVGITQVSPRRPRPLRADLVRRLPPCVGSPSDSTT
jgi:hypothetical protein